MRIHGIAHRVIGRFGSEKDAGVFGDGNHSVRFEFTADVLGDSSGVCPASAFLSDICLTLVTNSPHKRISWIRWLSESF
jgi:hypothetical protein